MDINELLESVTESAEERLGADFPGREKVLAYAEEAQLSQENIKRISELFDTLSSEERSFIRKFYYLQYLSGEDFLDNIWRLDEIKRPERAERDFPGYINTVTYLAAVENLEEWLKGKDFDVDEVKENYYQRFRYIVGLNLISHKTEGLCRLSPFLYGYSKPFILRVGRLNFQYTAFKDYCEIYEDEAGVRTVVALPNYTYDESGLQSHGGHTPSYELKGTHLTAHTFDGRGRLTPDTVTLDLSALKRIYAPGENTVTIHIPKDGKLDREEVKASLERAYRVLSKYFPPFYTFVCQTWFIDPGLRGEVVRDGSNMAAFADLFDIISGPDNNYHSLYEHVFCVDRCDMDQLQPMNDFQRRLLDRCKRGERMFWGYGVLKKELCDKMRAECSEGIL